MASEGPIVLSFHNTLLRESDVATLGKGRWLNDNVISFYLQYLEKNVYWDIADDVAFVAAEVVQLMKSLSAPDISAMFGHLKSKKLIVLPINDCDVATWGGSHWSLLIYYRDAFFHLDSSSSSSSKNIDDARLVARLVSKALFGRSLPIRELGCASQHNSSDCGVYVLQFAEIACMQFMKNSDQLSEKPFAQVTGGMVDDKRRKILELIKELSSSDAVSSSEKSACSSSDT